MNFNVLKEAELLQFVERMFKNIPEVSGLQDRLEEVGYSEAKIQEGITLFDTFKNDYFNNQAQELESKKTRIEKEEKFDLFKVKMSKTRKALKVIFSDDSMAQIDLELNTPYPRLRRDQLTYAKKVINKLIERKDLHPKIVVLKLNEESLQAFKEEIDMIDELNQKFTLDKGLDQTLTEQKSKSKKELIDWCSKFMIGAKYATDDNEQMIEGLGVVV